MRSPYVSFRSLSRIRCRGGFVNRLLTCLLLFFLSFTGVEHFLIIPDNLAMFNRTRTVAMEADKEVAFAKVGDVCFCWRRLVNVFLPGEHNFYFREFFAYKLC